MNLIKQKTKYFNKIPIITGPTASGKSGLAFQLAQKIQGSICGCDSMQIYRQMDIGTAKPGREEQTIIPHYLFDIIDFQESFNVVKYRQEALHAIDACLNAERLPIFCGGTGPYVSALAENIQFVSIDITPEITSQIEEKLFKIGANALHQELSLIDPDAGNKIHPNNHRRLIRALEIYYQTGKTMTYYNSLSKALPPPFPFIIFAIQIERQTLYQQINNRVELMIQQGLVEEVAGLMQLGLKNSQTAYQGIGYKEIIEFLENKITLENAVEKIKINTRHYAKRQLTWLKHKENIHWISPDDIELICQKITSSTN